MVFQCTLEVFTGSPSGIPVYTGSTSGIPVYTGATSVISLAQDKGQDIFFVSPRFGLCYYIVTDFSPLVPHICISESGQHWFI